MPPRVPQTESKTHEGMQTRNRNQSAHPGYIVTGDPVAKLAKKEERAKAVAERVTKKAEAYELAKQRAEAHAELITMETVMQTRAKSRAGNSIPPIPKGVAAPPHRSQVKKCNLSLKDKGNGKGKGKGQSMAKPKAKGPEFEFEPAPKPAPAKCEFI